MALQALQLAVVYPQKRSAALWTCNCSICSCFAGRHAAAVHALMCRASLFRSYAVPLRHFVDCMQQRCVLSRLWCAGEGAQENELFFHTVYSGILTVRRSVDRLYHLNAPRLPPQDPLPSPCELPTRLLQVSEMLLLLLIHLRAALMHPCQCRHLAAG
jgi:hypothetical protein